MLYYCKVRQPIIDECTAEHVAQLEGLIGKLARRLMQLPGVIGVRVKIAKLEIFFRIARWRLGWRVGNGDGAEVPGTVRNLPLVHSVRCGPHLHGGRLQEKAFQSSVVRNQGSMTLASSRRVSKSVTSASSLC